MFAVLQELKKYMISKPILLYARVLNKGILSWHKSFAKTCQPHIFRNDFYLTFHLRKYKRRVTLLYKHIYIIVEYFPDRGLNNVKYIIEMVTKIIRSLILSTGMLEQRFPYDKLISNDREASTKTKYKHKHKVIYSSTWHIFDKLYADNVSS